MDHLHGWPVEMFWVFAISNVAIFVAYARIGWRHYESADDSLSHLRYGMFISSCGMAHLMMAWHMVSGMDKYTAMTVSHLLTAMVSVWADIGRGDG